MDQKLSTCAYVYTISLLDLHRNVNKIIWNLEINCTVCKICINYILQCKNAHNTHTFENLALRSNYSYPYSLGFDCKISPNTCTFSFTGVSLKGFGGFGDILQYQLWFYELSPNNGERNLGTS